MALTFWETNLGKCITPHLLLLAETTVVQHRVHVSRQYLQDMAWHCSPTHPGRGTSASLQLLVKTLGEIRGNELPSVHHIIGRHQGKVEVALPLRGLITAIQRTPFSLMPLFFCWVVVPGRTSICKAGMAAVLETMPVGTSMRMVRSREEGRWLWGEHHANIVALTAPVNWDNMHWSTLAKKWHIVGELGPCLAVPKPAGSAYSRENVCTPDNVMIPLSPIFMQQNTLRRCYLVEAFFIVHVPSGTLCRFLGHEAHASRGLSF